MAGIKDWFVPVASGLAALLGVWNVHLNNQASSEIELLKSRFNRAGGERDYAGKIMDRYDDIVLKTQGDCKIRLSRLNGIRAMAALITHDKAEDGDIDTRPIQRVILDESASCLAKYDESAKTATGADATQLTADYGLAKALNESAKTALAKADLAKAGPAIAKPAPAVVAVASSAAFDSTRFDIFWCAGTEKSPEALALATTLSQLRPASSTAAWNVKVLSAEKHATPGYSSITGLMLRIDVDSERGVANEFAKLARTAGAEFVIQKAPNLRTANIVSAFICPV